MVAREAVAVVGVAVAAKEADIQVTGVAMEEVAVPEVGRLGEPAVLMAVAETAVVPVEAARMVAARAEVATAVAPLAAHSRI